MAVSVRLGHVDWSGTRDREGYRTYKITHYVTSTTGLDGPANVMQCPGLPTPGNFWFFHADIDIWAWHTGEQDVKPRVDGERNKEWVVTSTFTNKPPGDRRRSRCQDQRIEDPLLEPMKISGTFSLDKLEASYDRFGRRILSSSHEALRGPQVEFDEAGASVSIEQNVADLQLPLLARMNNCVNDVPMWGLPARSVRLKVKDWRQVFYGLCNKYYTRSFELEAKVRVDPETGLVVSGWDRDLLDEGTKALNGEWDKVTGAWVLKDVGGSPPDPDNPAHFCIFTDRKGNPCRVILDGNGLPSEVTIGTGTEAPHTTGKIHVEKYNQANLFLLGLPATV